MGRLAQIVAAVAIAALLGLLCHTLYSAFAYRVGNGRG